MFIHYVFLFYQDSYVIAFLAVVEQHCKQNNFLTRVDFSFEHPVEEISRVLFAVLLKHLGLAYMLIPILDACKFIHNRRVLVSFKERKKIYIFFIFVHNTSKF